MGQRAVEEKGRSRMAVSLCVSERLVREVRDWFVERVLISVTYSCSPGNQPVILI
jgi:hypothetical protein